MRKADAEAGAVKIMALYGARWPQMLEPGTTP